MHRSIAVIIALGVSAAVAAPALAGGGGAGNTLRARLNGFQEVPQTISTDASGRFQITVAADQADYRLVYRGLEAVQFAHIHFGRPFTAGGVIVFLCNNATDVTPPQGTPPCPANGEAVTGTLSAASVVGPEGQGIEPGEFDEFLRALRQRATYVNVHTTAFPDGEIRGNIEPFTRRPARR